MAVEDKKGGFSLSRWSQRKLAAAREAEAPDTPQAPAKGPVPPVAASATATAPPAQTSPLPAVESLTFDSDFTAFLGPKVDEALRRRALRTLFRDPRFNVMDGLDVYIDDYSKFEVLDPEIVKQLVQSRYIFAPPPTRVNAEGIVEDVPTAGEAPALPEVNELADAQAIELTEPGSVEVMPIASMGETEPAAPTDAADEAAHPDDPAKR